MLSSGSSSPSRLRYVPALLMILSGLFLAIAGARLATLGGSWFYLPMGLATLAAGVLLWRAKPAGALLFGAALIVALIWAPLDAGWNFWPLVSRLFVFGVQIGRASCRERVF